jgi:hypothetical protein
MTSESQNDFRITRATLPQAVQFVLSECRSQLERATQDSASRDLIRDLSAAVDALGLIDEEIRGNRAPRPKGQRSASFIRYVIDEGERMVMNPILKQKVVEIEDIYSRG